MTATPRPPGWQHAACRHIEDPDVFFPNPHDTAAIGRAKTFCGHCPIVAACATWSIDLAKEMRHNGRILTGIFGGLDDTDRAPLIKVRAECGTNDGYELHVNLGEVPDPACILARRRWRDQQLELDRLADLLAGVA